MNSPSRCPNCDGPLAPTTGDPMCPACLMRSVLHPSDSELGERFLTETRPLVGGQNFDSMQSIGATTALADLDPGTQFGDYRIVRRLGRGGMGVVYEADHIATSRRVALKVLAQSLDQPEARARFLREGRLAASINHPNSVYVYGTEEIEGIPTITMELVDGGTLAELVKKSGPMPIRGAVDAVLQIIDGLAAADGRGVLHRDVKPSNCFVASDGTVKVGDFGLSISTTGGQLHSMTDVTIEGTFLGTPAFASPEQLRGEPLDRRSDIYSVGVTLFYLITGKVPFDADNMIHLLATVLDKPAPSAALIRSDLSAELDSVITRCLQKSSGERFDSYESLRYALKPFSSESPIAASPGDRMVAGIVDATICWCVLVPVSFLTQYRGDFAADFSATQSMKSIAIGIMAIFATMAYYAIGEWKYGYTIGKKLLGLRVNAGDDRATFKQTTGRAFLYLGVPVIPSTLFHVANLSRDSTELYFGPVMILAMMVGWSYFFLKFGLFLPARASNGYAAIHDRLTSTRVLERAAEANQIASDRDQDSFDFEPDAAKIGPYHRLQVLFEQDSEQLILGYDAKLLRRVWLHLQPLGTPSVTGDLRNSSEKQNLRWLGGRRSETECWDCYEAPAGQSLISLRQSVSGTRALRIIGRLTNLLTRSSVDQNLATEDTTWNQFTLERLWATDLDEIKLLPFDLPSENSGETKFGDAPTVSPESPAAPAVQLLRRAATCLMGSEEGPSIHNLSWSLSYRNAMLQVAHAADIAEAQGALNGVNQHRPIKLRSRVFGLVGVSLAFPLMTVLFGIFASFLYESQKSSYPELDQLYEVAQVLNREEQLSKADRVDRVVAVQRYVAGNFKELLNDKDKMNSMYAVVRVTPADRLALRQAINSQQPTPEELRDATERYESLRQESLDNPGNRVEIQVSFWATLGPAYVWLEFIWFPSLMAGLLFRGGLLMRLFGLVLVNRRGKRASRLRVFIRMFIGGLPVQAIIIGGVSITIGSSLLENWSELSVRLLITFLLGIVALTMLVVPYFRGNQCLSDRFAGTYFMVK